MSAPSPKACRVCETEKAGCGCDGALDDGCFLCSPKDHRRPLCESGCPNYDENLVKFMMTE